MRLVLDSNVLVSALLHEERGPARVLEAVVARRDAVLFDARVVAEWRAVLARPKLARIDPARAAALVERLLATGERVNAPRWEGAMNDEDDRCFVEVALAGRADAIVTGNGRHFPRDQAFRVLAPAELAPLLGLG